MSYHELAIDLKSGSFVLCADGTITLTMLSCDHEQGLIRCRCENSALLGERKNVNISGVTVDLLTITEKDKDETLSWFEVCLVNMPSRFYSCPSSEAPNPFGSLESLASLAVQIANMSKASLILVLTWGRTTARLVVKCITSIPVLSVRVIPILSTATLKAFDFESTDEAINSAIHYAKKLGVMFSSQDSDYRGL
uniref:Pyruvate kinase barrel domain-containing protein n=1 Tax=Leersia perrieri TaxID=77586 RepID=A0A0D9XD35_9ORYZ